MLNKFQAKKSYFVGLREPWLSNSNCQKLQSKHTHLSILKTTKGLFINFTYLVCFLYNCYHTSSDFTVPTLLSSFADIFASRFNRSRLGNCVVRTAASGWPDVIAHAHNEMFLTCDSRTVEQSFCVVTINLYYIYIYILFCLTWILKWCDTWSAVCIYLDVRK